MYKILFIRPETASLPEINEYMNYFNASDRFKAYDSSKIESLIVEDYDIIWEFKGIGGIKVSDKQLLVHEYASLSIGYFSKIKNLVKKKLNRKPDLRVYLNETIKSEFNFKDNVPYVFRDMGVSQMFFDVSRKDKKNTHINKEYKYVYVGDISKERKMDKFLDWYVSQFNNKLCLVGKFDDKIYKKYSKYDFIDFIGKVPYDQVPIYLQSANVGVNFIPNEYPFNLQTSTKCLEYLATGLEVLSTDYEWIQRFSSEVGFNYNVIDLKSNRILNEESIDNNYPLDPCIYRWDKVIKKSGIEEELLKVIKKRGK